MKAPCLSVVMIVMLLACGCAAQDSLPEASDEVSMEEITYAALDTVLSFSKSETRGTSSPPEIPEAFWAPEIAELEPLKVYLHQNNLAVLLDDADGECNGLYIYVPISSYFPSDDTIQVAVGEASYRFDVQK